MISQPGAIANRIEVVASLLDTIIDELTAIGLPAALVAKGTLLAALTATKLAEEQVEGLAPLIVGALSPYERAEVELIFPGPPGEPPPMPAWAKTPAAAPAPVPGKPTHARSLRSRIAEALTPLPATNSEPTR